MASLPKTEAEQTEQLWDEIGAIHAGMLGLKGTSTHFQPMAPHVDAKTHTIWFYSKADTKLVEALTPTAYAHFCVVGKNHDYHACLAGTLEVRNDPAKRDEYWSAMTEAWYHGKDDPLLIMLAFTVADAEIWASTGNTLKLGWEVAKANLSDDKTPDVGMHIHLRFA